NGFVFDPDQPEVRKIETIVRRSDVERNWERLQRQAFDMLTLARSTNIDVDSWQEVPGPNQKNACSAYGGCPFRFVCSKFETVEQYRRKAEVAIETAKTRRPADTWEDAWGSVPQKTPQTAHKN